MRCDYCGWVNENGRTRCVKCNQILPEQNTTTVQSAREQTEESTTSESSDCKFCTSCGYPIATDVTNCPACNAPIEQPVKQTVANPDINTKATIRDVSMAGVAQNMMRTPVNENFSAKMKQTVRDGIGAAAIVQEVTKESNLQPSAPKSEDLRKTVLTVAPELLNDELPKITHCENHWECRLTAVENFDNGNNIIHIENSPAKLSRKDIGPDNISIDENEHIGIECEDGKWYIENLSANNNTYIRVSRKMELADGDVVVIGNKKYIFTKG